MYVNTVNLAYIVAGPQKCIRYRRSTLYATLNEWEMDREIYYDIGKDTI